MGFLLGLPFITNGGFYLFELVDSTATTISMFIVLLLASFLVSRYIGIDVIQEIVANKTGKMIPQYILFSIKYICPIALFVLIFFSLEGAVILFYNFD